MYHRTKYSSKIDPYKEQIIEWRCEPYDFNGTRIYRELKKLGYSGSISPIYRFLRRVDEDVGSHISSKATVRHESPPGGQAQFYWTEYDVCVGGRYRTVYCFAMIIGDRLLESSRYVTLDPVSKTLHVDESSLKNDGYQIMIH